MPPRPIPQRSRAVSVMRTIATTLVGGAAAFLTTGLPAQEESPPSELTRMLAAHPFFQRVRYAVEPGRGEDSPFEYVLQLPAQVDDDYKRRILNWFSPFTNKLHQVFHDEYIRPLGLQRTDGLDTFRIAILDSKGAYINYSQAVESEGLHKSRAHFDPQIRLAVTYEDSFATRIDQSERRHALLHEFVHAMQNAYYAGPRDSEHWAMPKAQWFNEGLAEYRAVSNHMASSLDRPAVDQWHLRLVAALYAGDAQQAYIMPTADLIAIEGPGYGQVVERAAEKLGDLDERSADLSMQSFYAQSSILTFFLHEAEDGRFREGYNRYFHEVMTGVDGTTAWTTAFPDLTPTAADELFRGWVASEMERRHWSEAAIGQIAGIGDGAGRFGGRGAGATVSVPTFDYATVAWSASDWRPRLDAAVRRAADGAFDSAASALEGMTGPDEAASARIERERVRLRKLAEARRTLLGAARDKKVKLKVRYPDGKTRGRYVGSFDADNVTVGFGRVEDNLPISLFGSELLLEIADECNLLRGADAWIGPYLRLLEGADASEVASDLPAVGPIAKGLRTDLDGVVAAVQSKRHAWAAFANLAEPADADGARNQLRDVLAAIRTGRDDDELTSRRADLEQLVRYLFHRSFDPASPHALGLARGVHVRELGEGRLRITWDFENAEQLTNLVTGQDDLEPVRRALDVPRSPGGDSCSIVDGELSMRGTNARRLIVPLEAPFEIRYKARIDQVTRGFPLFHVGCCADDIGHFITSSMAGEVSVAADGVAGTVESGIRELTVGKTIDRRLVHDGKTLTSYIGSGVVARAENLGGLTSGHVFVSTAGPGPFVIDDLVVEGKVDAVAARALVDQRAAAAIEKAFGGD